MGRYLGIDPGLPGALAIVESIGGRAGAGAMTLAPSIPRTDTRSAQAASLPALIDSAAARLREARTSAEVIEAKAAAEVALHLARVVKATNATHGDCLRIIAHAESRMADEADAAQARGELARAGQHGEAVQTSDSLGLDRRRLAEWRSVRDAGPEAVEAAIAEALQDDRAPTKADVARHVGAARRGIVTGVAMHPYAERGLDLYETHAPAVRALLDVESFTGPIWEPACGPGAIVHVLRAAGHKVVATDIANYGCPDAHGGVDFLAQEHAPEGVTAIVTNPPYRDADEFVRRALELVPRVAMLLRVLFLASQGRSDILESGQLARVHVFRNRLPMMHRHGWDGPRSSPALDLAWYVWDRDHRGPAELHRISWTTDEFLDGRALAEASQ
jgi:hypothetical protein